MLSIRHLALSAILLAGAPLAPLAQDPLPIYPENYKVLLENDRVRVLNFKLRKGDKEDFHSHPAHVALVLTGFKIRFTLPGGETRIRETEDGDVLFSEAITHASENIGATDAHGILVELKTPQGEAAGPARHAAEWLTAVTFIRGLEGKEEELKKELLSLSAPTWAEPGNVAYDLYQSTDKKNHFVRFEIWRDAEALETHKATPHIRGSFQRRQEQGWTTEITTWKRLDP